MMSAVQVVSIGGGTGCPDDETLAVYLEGGLEADERTQFEAHMAGCDRCLELLVALAPHLADVTLERRVGPETGGTFPARFEIPVAALSAPKPAPPLPLAARPPRVTRWLLPLAAAAVLILGVGALLWSSRPGGLETLQAVHVSQRTTVGQLAGFEHAPPPPVFRSAARVDTTPLALLEKAADVFQAYEGRTDAASLHAAGVAQLIAGETEPAVVALSRAANTAPDDVRIVNDAAAAFLQKAQMTSDSSALAEARRLATRATTIDPAFTPAWFNLAKAASLAEDDAAERDALARLRQLDPQSPWLAELNAP